MLCQALCYDERRIVGWFSYIQTLFETLGYSVSLEFINNNVFKRSASIEDICAFKAAPHCQRFTKTL